jgi:hypothetical protein
MSRSITPATTLDNLKREAKRWLRDLRAGDAVARERLHRAHPAAAAEPGLRDVQLALAREHGLSGWAELRRRLEHPLLRRAEEAAAALVLAYRTPDPDAMRIVWDWFGHMRAWDGMRRYIRLDLGGPEEPENAEEDRITLGQARWLVARAQGFESWDALVALAESSPPARVLLPKQVGAYAAGDREPVESAVLVRSWDDLLATVRERGFTALHGGGQMTDDVLARVAALDHLEELDLSGSRALTGTGLRHLARLPHLRILRLGGCAVGDDDVAMLRDLPRLERIVLAGTRVTDAGVEHLAPCTALEMVDLSGTRTGDGAIRALAGKPALHDFRSGELVTGDGLALLRELPVFRTWQSRVPELELLGYDGRPNLLRLRGRFGDDGLAHLAELEGLFALDVDDERLAVTGAGLDRLAELPHFGWLSVSATDATMPHVAALPRLRFLVCQDTPAGDEGFAALSRSRSLEYLWGRRCHNLGTRGFAALADIPTLRSLSVSCLNVDAAGLALLPRFPALRELMPMDVPDDGYRHVAACERLESLVLMYCRETGDRATEWIVRLPTLRRYFASYTRITDRTPELLSTMMSLEEITFDSCAGLTDDGVAKLARLPQLRHVRLSGMPRVSRRIAGAFGAGVRVAWSA